MADSADKLKAIASEPGKPWLRIGRAHRKVIADPCRPRAVAPIERAQILRRDLCGRPIGTISVARVRFAEEWP
jgi:hypothetical protein